MIRRVRAALGDPPVGCFCVECGAPGTAAVEEGGRETFLCPAGHRSPRAFLFDGKAVFRFEEDSLLHESAGAIVRRDGRILLFRRRKYPPGWTIPAGHREEGMAPEAEMRREVLEETGLSVSASRIVWDAETCAISDACRRGADLHRWNVYEVAAAGDVRLNEEGESFGWFTEAEAMRLDLIPPVREIFSRLGFGRSS